MPSSSKGSKRHFVIPRPSHLRFMATNLDVIPEEARTYGPDVICELSKLEEWYDTWDTLTVHKDEGGIRSEHDVYRPHALQT